VPPIFIFFVKKILEIRSILCYNIFII